MKTLEEMEAHMRLDDLKQKRGVTIEDKKKTKKQGPAVVPIQIELISSDIDRLYSQIYAYFAVSVHRSYLFVFTHFICKVYIGRVGRIHGSKTRRRKEKCAW